MKYLIFLPLAFASFFAKSQSKYGDFIEFTVRHFNPPESAQRKCKWQYVIIKLSVNKDNQISAYQIMNVVEKGIFESLSHLKGYQFNKTFKLNKRHAIFCLGIENMRTGDCDTVKAGGHPRVLEELKRYQNLYKTSEKNSIYIYKEALKIIEDKVN